MENKIKKHLNRFEVKKGMDGIWKMCDSLNKKVDALIRSPGYKAIKEGQRMANAPCHLCPFRSGYKYLDEYGKLHPEWHSHFAWHCIHNNDIALMTVKEWQRQSWPYDWSGKKTRKEYTDA